MKKPDTLAAATWLISSALLEVEDLEAALTNTLDVISTQLKAEGGAIWILNEDTGTLHCAACAGPLDLMGVSFENGIGTEGQVVSTETSVFLAETEKTESFEGDIFDDQGLKTRSLICVPLSGIPPQGAPGENLKGHTLAAFPWYGPIIAQPTAEEKPEMHGKLILKAIYKPAGAWYNKRCGRFWPPISSGTAVFRLSNGPLRRREYETGGISP